MSTNTSKIFPTELDFDLIKKGFKEYLSSQDEFSEYNFEGSALNVLMDILGYNTHMNSYMANMLANELFLDSSMLRESVVSKAKEIGYLTRSVRASKAIVDISITNVTGTPSYLVMDAGTQFQNNFNISFSTKEIYNLIPSLSEPTTYVAENVEIYEGRYVEFSYILDSTNIDQRIFVPSIKADISSLRVIIKPDINSSTKTEYFLNDDINSIDPNSEIFFLHESNNGFYEISFGDGILGKKLINENFITLQYIISEYEDESNNIDQFDAYQRIAGYSGDDINIGVVEPSYGGQARESIDDIKFLAPKMYQSQKRAVTTEDYETFLLHEYPWIDTINSWGGEFNKPPIYGKVFFAIKPKHTEFISNSLKDEIINNLIKKYNVVTIVPEILNPDYIYINVNTEVYYNKSMTTLDDSELIDMTTQTINSYFSNTTEKFKMDFKFSPMTTNIDNTNNSFDSSLSNIFIHKRIYPIINLQQTFNIDFYNEIEPNTIESSYFNIEDSLLSDIKLEVVLKDDGNGIIDLIQVSTGNVLVQNTGNVNYLTGNISITIFPYSLPLDTLDVRIYSIPVNKNIYSGYNQIILPDDSSANQDVNRKQGISVNVIEYNNTIS